MHRINNHNSASFTLIELLVVLALVAILSVVVVMTLNPAELLKQARDSNRLSDLSTINTALNLFSADVTSGFMGTSTVVYVSLPDNSSSTCGSLGLPALPTGYTYSCVTSANLRKTDGTGWIPVNFQRISSNSPISQLPIDPQNTTSTKYYTYVTGGSWKVIATPESVKYTATAGTDGGSNIGQFEVGNNMSLAPFVDGLIGWWKLDEGSGTTAADSSGWGNNGTANGTTIVTGKVGNARNFSGGNEYVDTLLRTDSFSLGASSGVSVSGWIKKPFTPDYTTFISVGGNVPEILVSSDNHILPYFPIQEVVFSNSVIGNNTWSFLAHTYDPSTRREAIYIDGVLDKSWIGSGTLSVFDLPIQIGGNVSSYKALGSIDDIRVFRRVLSAAEILAIYNATK